MSTESESQSAPGDTAQPPPQVHVHNQIRLGGDRGWNVLITLLTVASITVAAYQLSLGPFADVVATGVAMFAITLTTYMFRAGILSLPAGADDDLAFTKSTLRRVYDEITTAIINSSMPRLILFAAGQTAAFLVFRAIVAFGLSLLNSTLMAIAVGLGAGAIVVGQDKIWAWVRRSMVKREGSR